MKQIYVVYPTNPKSKLATLRIYSAEKFILLYIFNGICWYTPLNILVYSTVMVRTSNKAFVGRHLQSMLCWQIKRSHVFSRRNDTYPRISNHWCCGDVIMRYAWIVDLTWSQTLDSESNHSHTRFYLAMFILLHERSALNWQLPIKVINDVWVSPLI